MTPVVLSSEHGSPQDCNPAQLQMLPGTEQGYKISKNHSVYRGSNNPTDTTTQGPLTPWLKNLPLPA